MSKTVGVYRRGRVWWIRYSDRGRRYEESAGTTVKREAEALLAKRKAEVFERRNFPEKRAADLTIAELRDLWLAHAKGKRSISDDTSRFQRIVEWFDDGDCPVSTITTQDVDKFRDALLEEKSLRGFAREVDAKGRRRKPKKERLLSKATANRHLALLRSALRFAEAEGYVTQRPQVRLLEERNSRADRIANAAELEQIVAGADGDLRLAIIIARWSGMRLGEIVNLTWDRIDVGQGIIRLREADTKSGEARKVPLGTPAIEALKAWPRKLGEPLVFLPKERKKDGKKILVPLQRETISSAFSKLTRELGIKDLRFHDLRGTRLTELRRAGADLKQIQSISGHKTLAILVERYQAMSEEELLEVARKAEQKK